MNGLLGSMLVLPQTLSVCQHVVMPSPKLHCVEMEPASQCPFTVSPVPCLCSASGFHAPRREAGGAIKK